MSKGCILLLLSAFHQLAECVFVISIPLLYVVLSTNVHGLANLEEEDEDRQMRSRGREEGLGFGWGIMAAAVCDLVVVALRFSLVAAMLLLNLSLAVSNLLVREEMGIEVHQNQRSCRSASQ